MKYKFYCLVWLSSFRLRTLPLAVSTIFVGSALAYWQNEFNWSIFLLTLVTATLLQILSNLANDYGDGVKGSDDLSRIGPKRAIHRGKITLLQLFNALIINVILSVFFGVWLLIVACQTREEFIYFILLGLLCIIAAILYTVGKNPYGYAGFGDLSVLLFFGLVSIMGSSYLQTNQIVAVLTIPAVSCGLLAVSVLNINNMRDIESDKIHCKKTLVVIFGFKAGKIYHCILLILALCGLIFFSFYYLQSTGSWLFLILLPLYFKHLKSILSAKNSRDMSLLFVPLIKIVLLTNLLYSLGIILS